MKNWTRRAAWLAMLATLSLMALPASAAGSYVPSAVITSQTTVPATGLTFYQANLAFDACGNIYAIQSGGLYGGVNNNSAVNGGLVTEIPAGGGAATMIYAAGGPSYDSNALFIDSTQSNLYITEGANSPQVLRIPIVNCVPQTANAVPIAIGNLGAVSYYWSAGSVAADTAGDVFIGTNADCCGNGNELVEEYAGYNSGATLLINLTSDISSIAVDAVGNIYYVSGGVVFELPVATPATASVPATYAAAPIAYGSGYSTGVVGVTIDSAGNLFVTDGGSKTQGANIFEIPFEGKALNPADQYVVASGMSITSPVALDASGNLYFTNVYYDGTVTYTGSSTYIYELTRNSANFGSQAVGTPAAGTLNVVFNDSVTPTSISVVPSSGDFAAATAGTCAASTAYTAGSACTVNATFTPAAPGLGRGALVLADASGTVATTSLYGVGSGAGLTIDPGTRTAIGSGIVSPKGIDLDAAGNLFVADSGNGTIWKIPAGATTPVSVATGFNLPEGIAVDGAGDVFVADTKNNQIVEIPVVNGVPSSAAQFTLIPSSASVAGNTLNGPTGLTVDAQGNLYIADTGNNRIVFVPQGGGWDLSQAFTLGTGFSAPLSTTVTSSGLIYIADSGHGKVYSIGYPGPSAPIALAATNFSNPSALRTDAAGDLFVVDSGNNKVVRIPNVGGTLATGSSAEVSFGIADPVSLAINSAGNLYIGNLNTPSAPIYVVNRTSPTLSFGNITPGTSSNPASVQVESAGNLALVLSTPYYVATGSTSEFAVGASEANACAASSSLAVGANCSVQATFSPSGSGTFNESLTLASNASGSAQINLAGVGISTEATTTTLTVTSPAGSPYYAEPIALSAAVTSATGTPSGTVALLVDGAQVDSSTLSNGKVSFALKNGLSGGTHTFQAVYSGATTTTDVFAGSESAVDTVIVTAVPTTTASSFATLNINPNSQPAGTPMVLAAAVASAYAGIPTGTVTFNVTDSGGQTIAPLVAPLVAASGGGFQATYSFTPPAPASGTAYNVLSFTATYSGDNNFTTSSSGSESFNVGPAIGAVLVTPSGTSLTSSALGSNSTVTFTNTSYGNWSGIIGYQCEASSLPANAICVFQPGQVTLVASTTANPYPPVTTSLQVIVDNPPNSPLQSSILWWMGGLTGVLLLFVRRRAMHGAWGRLTVLIGAALLAVSASGLMACNNGAQFATPSGTSTITVYAYSDPFVVSGGTINQGETQPCGGQVTGTNPPQGDPTQLPCQKATFQISLTVK